MINSSNRSEQPSRTEMTAPAPIDDKPPKPLSGNSAPIESAAPASALSAETEIVIRPGGGLAGYWAELWRFRELFFFLAWRDVKIRYKQTSIGVGWALLRPFMFMLIFTLIFSKLAKLTSPGDVPYPLMIMAGMLPWQFFAQVMGEGSNSLFANANLITKVYFPRLLIPASAVAVALVDLLISGVLLVGMFAWYGFLPPLNVLLLPFFMAIAFLAALGVGLLLSALTVRYRDVRIIIPFLVQFGFFATPIGYSTAAVPVDYRWLFALNPMVGAIEGFRWSLFGVGVLGDGVLPASLAMTAVVLVCGFRYFRATERQFADTI
jgi:lipopolysaccharide transport system permease protein